MVEHSLFVTLASFAFITLAAYQVGRFFSRFTLPLISGYLLAGIFAGPFVLQFMTTVDIEQLRFLDEVSLAFIAFAAGSEMYLKELQGRLRSIAWNTLTQLIAVYVITGVVVYLIADYIPFMKDLPVSGRIAATILAGTILVARSPSSAIAIINEVRARGPFTKTVLGVTLVKDVIVVVLFALSTSIASTLITGAQFDLSFILLVSFELIASLIAGLIIGRVLTLILGTKLDAIYKIALILVIGYLVFYGSAQLRHLTHEHLAFEILLEPLLICMVASFWLTNRSKYRDEFRYLLHRVEGIIFVIFFTLVGESLDIGIVLAILPITLVIFFARLAGLFIGGFTGGMIAGDDPQHNRYTWMAYITQAGVGLGLAKEVAIEFPMLGDDFTTLMVAVIVLSQLAGPPFFKFALRQVRESREKGQSETDTIRDVLILGIEQQSKMLAERLQQHNWRVMLADVEPSQMFNSNHEDICVCPLPAISTDHVRNIISTAPDAAVVMLPDDEDNLSLCEMLYEEFGVSHLIVRLNDYQLMDEFRSLGAHIVYPNTAMVHLLDSVVRTPKLATMILQETPHTRVSQITITDPSVHDSAIRDIVLPPDVLVISISRDGTEILPHGYTKLQLHDEVTLIGSPKSLKKATLKLGF